MYSKEPVQQVLGFLAWKMHARVAYHFNSNTNPTDKGQFSHHSILLIYITVVLRQMKQVINKNIFHTYFKCNIGCKCSKLLFCKTIP